MDESVVSSGAARQKKLSRGAITAIVLVALLVVGAGTAFGLHAYRDAQARSTAEALVESVVTERELAEAEHAEFLQRLNETQAAHEQLVTLTEMSQARADVFGSDSLTVFGESVATLESRLHEAVQPDTKLADQFSGSEWAETLIEDYRRATAVQRLTLETEVQQTVDALREAQSVGRSTSAYFVDGVLQARRAAVQLAEQLPAKAEELIQAHNEAGSDAQEALREASSTVSFEEVSDEMLQAKVDELQDHLIVYIETADKLKASHTTAVEEREAAEAAAAEAAAAEAARAAEATRSQGSGAGGSGSSGGSSLCYRWTWLGTVLEPC